MVGNASDLPFDAPALIVGGVRFDALQVGVRVLWESKTHQFDTYNDFIKVQEVRKEYEQMTPCNLMPFCLCAPKA